MMKDSFQMSSATRNTIERWPTTQRSEGPLYHVYSHYGCSSEQIDRCTVCRYLLQDNTYLHSNPRSLISATTSPPVRIERELRPTPIEPIRYRIDEQNDLYILPDLPSTPRTRREAEDAAIINICLKDKTIDRIILIDADEKQNFDENVRYVRMYDVDD